jgi:hypothetical protein
LWLGTCRICTTTHINDQPHVVATAPAATTRHAGHHRYRAPTNLPWAVALQ